jgi:hypothetical protein
VNGLELADLVKRRTIIAIAADDMLMQRLVFKGGNALVYAHGITARGSFDIDFSMEGEFNDIEELRTALQRTLRSSFEEVSLIPFDINVLFKPPHITEDMQAFWGGYSVDFKLIEARRFPELQNDSERLRRHALAIGPPGSKTKFEIDISPHEYCGHRQIAMIDDYRIYVYSPTAIICEKLRAICQQLPEYDPIVKRNREQRRGRAADFLDICSILDRFPIEPCSPEFRGLLSKVFSAKRVPIPFLRHIPSTFSMQQADFQRVLDTVSSIERLQSFESYFNRVVNLCSQLEPLGDE